MTDAYNSVVNDFGLILKLDGLKYSRTNYKDR